MNRVSQPQSIFQSFFATTVNIYGFTRVKTAGKATGSYVHPLFIRGNPDACQYMVRIKVKKKGIRNNSTEVVNTRKLARNVSPPLTHGPTTLNNSPMMNGNIEPTPIRAVSLGQCDISMTKRTINDSIEPTPFHLSSLGSHGKTKEVPVDVIHRDVLIVPNGSGTMINREILNINRQDSIQPIRLLISMNTRTKNDDASSSLANNTVRIGMPHPFQLEQQRNIWNHPRHAQYHMVDLDLDTIFDTEDTRNDSCNNIDDGNNTHEKNISSNFTLDHCFSTNHPRIDDHVFDQNFHMVEESMLGILA
jgi:hypothetical protein